MLSSRYGLQSLHKLKIDAEETKMKYLSSSLWEIVLEIKISNFQWRAWKKRYLSSDHSFIETQFGISRELSSSDGFRIITSSRASPHSNHRPEAQRQLSTTHEAH